MKKTKIEFHVFLAIAFVVLMGKATIDGINKQEIKECQNWQEQASIYPNFYLLDWQEAQCMAHGLEIAPRTAIEPKKASKVTTAIVFAYNSEIGQTDDDPFTMASGRKVYTGAIACPSKYPFETIVEFRGIKYTCEDRMNKRYREGNYFDIWMESKEDAINWGRQEGLITIY